MSNTATDLAQDVGFELGILHATGELSAEDSEDLQRRSRRIHAWLRTIHVCYWDEDDIPDEVYEDLVLYLASRCGKRFGKSVRDDGLDEAGTRRVRLEALKTSAKPRYTGKKLVSDYPVSRGRSFNFTTG